MILTFSTISIGLWITFLRINLIWRSIKINMAEKRSIIGKKHRKNLLILKDNFPHIFLIFRQKVLISKFLIWQPCSYTRQSSYRMSFTLCWWIEKTAILFGFTSNHSTEKVTYNLPWHLAFKRFCIATIRVFFPRIIIVFEIDITFEISTVFRKLSSFSQALLTMPLLYIFVMVLRSVFIWIGFKWLVMGRYKTNHHPIWTFRIMPRWIAEWNFKLIFSKIE